MLTETPRAASGAAIIDLHSVRAGLTGRAAELDQDSALARRPAEAPCALVADPVQRGDLVRYNPTREVGIVDKLLPGGRAVVKLPTGQLLAWTWQCASAAEPECELPPPCDCEAAS